MDYHFIFYLRPHEINHEIDKTIEAKVKSELENKYKPFGIVKEILSINSAEIGKIDYETMICTVKTGVTLSVANVEVGNILKNCEITEVTTNGIFCKKDTFNIYVLVNVDKNKLLIIEPYDSPKKSLFNCGDKINVEIIKSKFTNGTWMILGNLRDNS
jgi:hypothetical protein